MKSREYPVGYISCRSWNLQLTCVLPHHFATSVASIMRDEPSVLMQPVCQDCATRIRWSHTSDFRRTILSLDKNRLFRTRENCAI